MSIFVNKFLIAVFAVSICSCFVACDDTENSQVAEILSFTEIKELDIDLLESEEFVTGYFVLEATGIWSVSSDKMWVTFSTEANGEFYYDIQGGEDIDTVYVRASNVARDFTESNAVVTLLDDVKEYTVGIITRPAESYEFALLTSEGKTLDKVDIDGSASLWVGIGANYDCSIIDYPSWLMEPVPYNNGFNLNVVKDSVPMEQNGVLVFANRAQTMVDSIAINYAGMDPKAVEIEGDSPWGWIVSLDGKEFKKDQSSLSDSSEESIVYDFLNMDVICRDYSFHFVFAENNSEKLSIKDENEAWIKATRCEDSPKSVKVTVDEYEFRSSRSGYLFAVPDALLEDFKGTLELGKDTITFASNNDSISIYNYVLAEVIQKDEGFKVYNIADDSSKEEVECEKDENADYYVRLSNEYSITDVMACDVKAGEEYILDTKLSPNEWNGTSFNLFDMDDPEKTFRLSSWIPDLEAELEDGCYRMMVCVPEASWFEENKISKNIVLRLYASPSSPVNIKAIVFRVQE